ncbi:hypothetical protein ACRCJU_02020 [Aerococcus urinaeequi]|uniref:hypothetical protein n=1 Tax=Aerococcus urinaeequi TaxID=51665 RepID=UPI003D6B25BA
MDFKVIVMYIVYTVYSLFILLNESLTISQKSMYIIVGVLILSIAKFINKKYLEKSDYK